MPVLSYLVTNLMRPLQVLLKSKMRYVFALVLLFVFGSVIAQPRIIIKLDDLGSRNSHSSAEPVIDILLQRKIKAGLGIIAAQLDSTAGTAYSKYLIAINDNGEKLFEIWNHGFNHSNNNPPNNNMEFKGTGYDFQKDHLTKAQARVKKLLGVTMHTFGAPYNASDSITNKVLGEQGDYRVFLFGNITANLPANIKNYDNRVEMEITTGQVNYDHFIADYKKYKNKYNDLMVLQGHPNMWDAARIAEFNKILDFLIAQKCEFVLPVDYYLKGR
jgi:peptidoglycan/xylan/chitin deacetylase (PgdA/CDA1 family)